MLSPQSNSFVAYSMIGTTLTPMGIGLLSFVKRCCLEDLRQEAQDMIVEDDGQVIQAESSVKIKILALKEKAHKVDPVGERPQKRLCRE